MTELLTAPHFLIHQSGALTAALGRSHLCALCFSQMSFPHTSPRCSSRLTLPQEACPNTKSRKLFQNFSWPQLSFHSGNSTIYSFFWPHHMVCGTSPTRGQTCVPCSGIQSLNHQTTREALYILSDSILLHFYSPQFVKNISVLKILQIE